MDPRQLFVRTVHDLASRVRVADQYELLRASLLLRQLLIDTATPLVDVMRRKHRIKIRYQVSAALEAFRHPGALVWHASGLIDPFEHGMPPGEVRELTLDQFLATVVYTASGVDFSVHDVIKIEAHASGGVHSSVPMTAKERLLHALNQTSYVMGATQSRSLLRPIGSVVVRALTPLVAAVQQELKDDIERNHNDPAAEVFPLGVDEDALSIIEIAGRGGLEALEAELRTRGRAVPKKRRRRR